MATLAKMYEIYPCFFSSTNKYLPDAEIYRLDTLDSSFKITKFAKEIIFTITANLPVRSFLRFRSTSRYFQKTLSVMPPEIEKLVAQLSKEYKARQARKIRDQENDIFLWPNNSWGYYA
jgi:hypothetical protein